MGVTNIMYEQCSGKWVCSLEKIANGLESKINEDSGVITTRISEQNNLLSQTKDSCETSYNKLVVHNQELKDLVGHLEQMVSKIHMLHDYQVNQLILKQKELIESFSYCNLDNLHSPILGDSSGIEEN